MLTHLAQAAQALLLMALIGCAAALTDPFLDMQPATSSDYGYSSENPIRIKYRGNERENISLCMQYIGRLRTKSGDALAAVERMSCADPKHEPSSGGFLGLPARGGFPSGGVLDAYTLVSEGGLDTLLLFFDIYHKEPLSIPSGLFFVGNVDSLSTTGD